MTVYKLIFQMKLVDDIFKINKTIKNKLIINLKYIKDHTKM